MDKSLRKNELLRKTESIWKRDRQTDRQTDRGELEEKNVERPLEKKREKLRDKKQFIKIHLHVRFSYMESIFC